MATNLLGNCVAVFAVSRWEGALDRVTAKKVLNGEHPAVSPADGPAEQDRLPERAETVPDPPKESVAEPGAASAPPRDT